MEKIGYVKSYKVNSNTHQLPHLVLTLTDDEDGIVSPEEFNLFYAISYSNITQAIIATVKEAFIHREKVTIEYSVSPLEVSAYNPAWWAGKKIILSIWPDQIRPASPVSLRGAIMGELKSLFAKRNTQ